MTRDEAISVAQYWAIPREGRNEHSYQPKTAIDSFNFQPHDWVIDAIMAMDDQSKRTHPPTPPAVDGDVVRDALKYRNLATPEIKDFLLAVEREALHQRERWAVDHDAGKTATDWLWLIAFLSTKATQADRYGEPDKYLHHIITTAAACLNWHAHAIGADTRMRPSADPLGENGAAIRAQKEGK